MVKAGPAASILSQTVKSTLSRSEIKLFPLEGFLHFDRALALAFSEPHTSRRNWERQDLESAQALKLLS
jgi:hypothetical protein